MKRKRKPKKTPAKARSFKEFSYVWLMPFEDTTSNLVLRVQSSDSSLAKEALDQLCQNYWQPLYIWLRHSGESQQDALDYVQGFFYFVITKSTIP